MNTVGSSLLTDAEYRALCDLVYREFGLRFDGARRDFVESRLRIFLERHADQSPGEYIRRVQVGGKAWRELVDALTINETYFFRDLGQLELFRHLLTEMLPARAVLPYARLRIWTAGCSIGCEPYTLAMLVNEEVQRQGVAVDWQILATDISPSALEVAQSALYVDREVRGVPPDLLPRYFRRREHYWEFAHPCRSRVQFRYSNLLSPGREVQGPFDLAFCRNVMIYFDDAARRQAADVLYDHLTSGGYLFLGAAESLSRISRAFELRRVGGGLVYVRQ